MYDGGGGLQNKSNSKNDCDKINAAAVVFLHVTLIHIHTQSHCQARIVNRGAMQQNAVLDGKINWFQ